MPSRKAGYVCSYFDLKPWLTLTIQKQNADNKLSDAFYDALEGLLADLKSLPLVRGSMTVCDDNLFTLSLDRITAMQKRFSSQYQKRRSQIITTVRSTAQCDLVCSELKSNSYFKSHGFPNYGQES